MLASFTALFGWRIIAASCIWLTPVIGVCQPALSPPTIVMLPSAFKAACMKYPVVERGVARMNTWVELCAYASSVDSENTGLVYLPVPCSVHGPERLVAVV